MLLFPYKLGYRFYSRESERAKMDCYYANVRYWFVEHPLVSEFEWKDGETWGASPRFLITNVVAYLSLTLILYYYITHISKTTVQGSWFPTLIRRVSTLHNLILVLISLAMATGCALSTASQMTNRSCIFCFPRNEPANGPVFFWAYIFYLSKILEFMDTLFILLSKDTRRLTFLHVYHHAAVIVMCYLWLQYRQSLLPIGVFLNSSVHTVMYTYYMMCTLGKRPGWKKFVTDFQLVQFWTGFPVSVVMWWLHFTGDGCSGLWSWFYQFVFNVSLIILFSSFHAKNYGKNKNKKTV